MKIILITLMLSICISLEAKTTFEKMDKDTAITTGIYKLSAQEKEALLNWFNSNKMESDKTIRENLKEEIRTEIVAENAINEELKKEIIKNDKIKNMGFTQEETGQREEIYSILKSVISKKKNNNIYHLENGQVWKQSGSGSLYIPKTPQYPKVTIKPKSLNSWSLYIDGFSRSVKVKRIK